jgi:hypothetical protein
LARRAIRYLCLTSVVALLMTACGRSGNVAAPPHVDLGGSRAALVSAFNADKGKVRAVLIASPT